MNLSGPAGLRPGGGAASRLHGRARRLPTHLPEMAAIYREQIAAGLGSFEDPLPDAAELGRRLAAVREAGLPAYVAVDGDGRVLGFCWARPFRAIAAYSKTVEDSIHVASDARRHGVGRALLEALIAACRKLGCRADDRGGRRRPQPGLDPAPRAASASRPWVSCPAPATSRAVPSTSSCCSAR